MNARRVRVVLQVGRKKIRSNPPTKAMIRKHPALARCSPYHWFPVFASVLVKAKHTAKRKRNPLRGRSLRGGKR